MDCGQACFTSSVHRLDFSIVAALCKPPAFLASVLIIHFNSHCQYSPQSLLGAQSPDWNVSFSFLCLGADKVWSYSEVC